MALPVFPILPGQKFATKRPLTATRVEAIDSGREIRSSIYGGLWEFELSFDGLASDSSTYPGLSSASLQALLGLWLQCRGGAGLFLYTDPDDNSVVRQSLGLGDGATTQFPFVRSLGGAADIVGYVANVGAVLIGGQATSAGWSLTAPNILSFSTPPAVGATVAASFSYQFVCCFQDDAADFSAFMQNLWQTKNLKFRSVLQ